MTCFPIYGIARVRRRARHRLSGQLAASGAPEAIEAAKRLFDPNTLTPQFSGNRAVREYTEQHYLTAAAAYKQRVTDKGAVGRQVVEWQQALEKWWDSIRFGALRVESDANRHVIEVEIFLDGLEPEMVRVELYADGINGGDPVREEMNCAGLLPDASRKSIYRATLPSTRPASECTARVIPQRPS